MGYFLELDHGLMGFFPAIITGMKMMILVFERELIFDIWQILEPRPSKLAEATFYVSEEHGVAFPTHDTRSHVENPIHFLTRSQFERLFEKYPDTFGWAPGLIGNDMSEIEFLQTIKAAADVAGIKLEDVPENLMKALLKESRELEEKLFGTQQTTTEEIAAADFQHA